MTNRNKGITLAPVPGHRFPLLLVIQLLCSYLYAYWLWPSDYSEDLGGILTKYLVRTGKKSMLQYGENWIKKLGLSVYQDDQPCKGKSLPWLWIEHHRYKVQETTLALAIPSEHQDRPVKHEDVTVLNMTVGANFKGEDIENKISESHYVCRFRTSICD